MKLLKLLKSILTILLCAVVLFIAVFLIGRYGWKLGGFSICESAGIRAVEVGEEKVRIVGFYPGSFPQGFLGYHAEQVDSTLYVGFKFSGLFGCFELGEFDITIPTDGTVSQVVIKTGENEYPIWSEEDNLLSEETEEAAVPTAYENILSQYHTALKENWDGQQLADTELDFIISDVSPETVGYAVKDFDDNGIPELAIGTLSGDDFYGKLIFVLYTMNKDGKPVQILNSNERNRFYYAGGNLFANSEASAADESLVATFKLDGEGLVASAFTADKADYMQLELTPFAEAKEK